jgi:hypothetical protein
MQFAYFPAPQQFALHSVELITIEHRLNVIAKAPGQILIAAKITQ